MIELERRSARVVWTSGDPLQGKVFYRPAAGTNPPMEDRESLAKSYRHQVQLNGLEPGTRYTYWIDGHDQRFQFQTQPENNAPFSFLMLSGRDAKKIERLLMTEIPDFILDLTPPSSSGDDPYKRIRPYMPVFDRYGVQSPFLKKKAEDGKEQAFSLIDWGGLQIMAIKDVSGTSALPDTPNGLPLGIFVPEESFGTSVAEETSESDSTFSILHQMLVRHNRLHPDRAVVFAAVPAEDFRHRSLDGINYLGMKRSRDDDVFPIKIDVDVNSVYADFLDTGEKIALKEPPLKERITCDDCRRLADHGAYEAAIEAYLSFIRYNAGHFQIDDAYFAVAELYDEKLFDYRSALDWYGRLL